MANIKASISAHTPGEWALNHLPMLCLKVCRRSWSALILLALQSARWQRLYLFASYVEWGQHHTPNSPEGLPVLVLRNFSALF